METVASEQHEPVERARPRAARRVACAMAALGAAAMLAARAGAQPVTSENPDGKPKVQDRPQPAPASMAAMDAFADRPVREVRLVGLEKTDTQLIRNNIRTRAGQPLSPETVREDIHLLNRLARFREINARVKPFDDGSVEVTYEFVETPVIRAVDIIGNRQVPNSEIQPLVNLLQDTPVDEFQLGQARAAIERMYRDKGYYQATVTVDQKELDRGSVLFRVAEGERVRVTDIRFEGNNAFKAKQITPHIKTTTAGIFETGPVDPEQLDRDVSSIVEFYQDRGYLDVRADRQVIFSPNGKEAIVKFVVEEGPLYTLRSVKPELTENGQRTGRAPTVLSPAQIAGLMEIKAGDVYSVQRVRRSVDAVLNAYRSMGYADARVVNLELRDPGSPQVDLLLLVIEGERFKTGMIRVKGNSITQDKIILRELTDLKPDRPLDMSFEREPGGREVTEAERRIRDTNLFDPAPSSTKLTVQPEDPANPGYRDVLLEVKETNTGSLSFGVGAGTDSGLVGLVSLNQRNFDVADWPDSWGELFAGRAFRGAGQTFNISLSPGTEVQTYSISLSDPNLLDTDYSGSVAGFYYKRNYDQYDERRIGSNVSIGRRFGERWQGVVTLRLADVNISNIDADAPTDLFAVQGSSDVTGLGVRFTRNTLDSRVRATRGSKTEAGVERVGAAGGDYDFTVLTFAHQVFIPVYESFLGYRTVLSWRTQIGYIPEGPDHAPIFERLYLGGRTFRGFKYRTVSPKGIRNDNGQPSDEPVGGTWQFFTGLELQQPLWKDIVAGVVFLDTGTVTNTPGFDQYRVSVGVGLRIAVPQLGPVPLAFDFGFPILKEDRDSSRNFSFTLDVPF